MNIRLLGPPEIVKADGTIPTFTTAKSAGLFYYLVATRQRHTRSALAQLFWRDMSEQKARVNLSKALSDLRRNFGNHLEITTKGIYFSHEQEYWLDVAHFLAEHPPQQTSTSLQTLQQQVALYNGDFLQGFDVRNAPEFEDWVRTQRNVLRTLAVERLAVLATYYHNQGEIDAAIAGWRHLLTLERWHENAHVALMKLLAQTGNLHAALKQYEQYRTAVADELDVDPGAEVVALYHTLRANSVTAKSLEQQEIGTIVGSDALSAGKAVGSPTAVDPYPLRLIGRQSAWQQLVGAWQQTQPQGSHCVLLCGEAGIGKSYLADAFVAYLETMDVVIFRSRYYANDAYSTFSPMYDWMRDPRLQAVIQQLPNFVQQDIARFHPNLLEENPQLAPPEPAFLPYQKRRLFDSILAALDGLQSSIVLYIDDMHWMDPETATWLHHALNSAQRRNALLIIGTMRNESLASLSAWSQWLKARQHAQLISEIYLTRLDLEETASLLAVIGNPALNATVAASIFEISEGNPLFIVELARVGWPHRSGNGIPTQIEGVLAQRLRHVATDLTDLLQLAAVVGREFDYRLLFTCLDLPESQMVEQLEAVCRLELVQALSETIYRFSHGLLPEVIYSS
ncbi:MAG: AAA family ATPase, partial [Caldilineaceae bacterium]|nr:AAA family ATPase [Caldilineaceae bacterium]